MSEPTLIEAVQTDRPSPKPNRRKRLALRFAALVVAVAALGPAYWLTRPPELVWWRSGAIVVRQYLRGDLSRHVRLRIPQGWEATPAEGADPDHGVLANYAFAPVDSRPKLLRWIFPPHKEKNAELTIRVHLNDLHPSGHVGYPLGYKIGGIDRVDLVDVGGHVAIKCARDRDEEIQADLEYLRDDVPGFNRTYKQICNSLTIE